MSNDETDIYAVRGFGFSVIHGARLLDSQIKATESPYRPGFHYFKAAATPVVSLCGVRIKSYRPVVIVMDEEVRCRMCRRVMRTTEETEVEA